MTKDIVGSEQIAYVFQLKIKDGSRPAFEALCTEVIEATRADAKAINYEFFIDGNVFHSFEKFSDSAATLAHLGWFGEKVAPRLLTMAEVTGLTVFGSPSDELREALDTMGATYHEPLGGFAR